MLSGTTGKLYGIILKSAGLHKFSSTQLNLTGQAAKACDDLAASIPDEDLAEDGRENQFHVTVLYGLHTTDAERIGDVLTNRQPVTVKVGKLSLFEAPEYDVLKYSVEPSDSLLSLRKKLSSLPHTSTHPDYHPHITIAYLAKGEGQKYCGDGPLTGQQLHFSQLQFSGRDGGTCDFPLDDRPAARGVPSGRRMLTLADLLAMNANHAGKSRESQTHASVV